MSRVLLQDKVLGTSIFMKVQSRRTFLTQSSRVFMGLALGQHAFGQSSMNPALLRPDIRHPDASAINLAGNENPYGPSPKAAAAISKAVSGSKRYPWREEYVLKKMIGQYEGVAKERVVLTVGCDELLAIAAFMAVDRGKNIISSAPTYEWLGNFGELRGGDVRWIPHDKDTMRHDLEGFKKATDANTGLIYLCNPDTPSGTILPAKMLADYILSVPRDVIVFMDEVYLNFLEDLPERTLTHLLDKRDNLIIGRSFSKLHGLAGHRGAMG